MRYCWSFLLFISSFTFSQSLPRIEEKTNGLKKLEGLFPLYWDENTGKLWLEIPQLEQEFLYVKTLPAGLGSNDIGLDRGMIGGSSIVKFSKTGRKLLLLAPNYDYRAVSDDAAERRAVEQSFAQSVLWGFQVEAESNGHVLVDATEFILRDALFVGAKLRSMKQGSFSYDRSRSAIYLPRTKNFPQNTEIETTITLSGGDGEAGNFLRTVIPVTDALTLRMHHSFVQLPDNDFQPRRFDPRSGYFTNAYFDYSTPVSEPIQQQFIARHRLKKKDPAAAVSEPVKPIIYYLDNGTPEPIRAALLNGATWWNQAFEAAGYKDAFQVRLLPDTADPMDIRYNMINWVHRSTRGWSYGAAVTDPRTGEIIKGNVTLGSLRVRQDYLIAQGLLAPFESGVPADDKMLKMALARLNQLSAHEIGHTLGLMHNYYSSVNDRASVMDYPHPLVRLNSQGEIDLSKAYDNKIGEWDKIAITWGYQDFPKGTDEKKALNNILTDAAKRGLLFIADRDARAPGGLHPLAHLWDNGNDAVTELKEVVKVRSKALQQFGVNNIRPGVAMAQLEDVLVPVYLHHRYQVEAVCKEVGGMFYTYATRGDNQTVTRPVSKEQQLKALNAVADCLEPGFLKIPDDILRLIPPRPAEIEPTRELFRKRTGLAFDALAPSETAADLPLSFLFHPERLSRMVQYEVQQQGIGVREMITVLVNRTWKAPRKTGMEKLIQQQTEQVLLTYLLASTVNENISFQAKADALQSLKELSAFIIQQQKTSKDNSYLAHLALAAERIRSPEKAQVMQHKEIPPGAPIGCDF